MKSKGKWKWFLDVKSEGYPFRELVPFLIGLSLMRSFDENPSTLNLVLIITYAVLCIVCPFVNFGWRKE